MHKRDLYTAIGVALSFCIAFGGWTLTKELLDRKENALFSVTGKIHVDVPIATPTDIDKKTDEESKMEIEPVLPKLSETEIFAVLQNWENVLYIRPHEPTEGQLNMEQAIEAGKTGLSYFCEQGIIPAELLAYEYDKTNAYLCENQPSEHNVLLLDPTYSYWTVSFTSESMNAVLTINAVTGQVWKAEIFSFLAGVNFNEVKIEQISDAFTSYLGLGDDNSFEAEGIITIKSFTGGMFYTIGKNSSVKVTSKIENELASYPMINFFLSTQTQ